MGDTSSHYGGCPCKQCNPPPQIPTFDSIEEAYEFNKFEAESEILANGLSKDLEKNTEDA